MPDENDQQQEEAQQDEFADLPEAAPTDYRRNIWLLAFMVGVVFIAWMVSLLRGF
jgi:hypothetical protein